MYLSIRGARQNFCKEISEKVKAELKQYVPLTIHWNEKLCEDINREEVVDKYSVLVFRNGADQLLSVPKHTSGTGKKYCSCCA